MIDRGAWLVGLTTRIRRRRAGGVDDTTDAIRAVACIRFVRPCSGSSGAHESVVCPPEPPRAKEVCVVIWASSTLRRSLACRGINKSTAIIKSTSSSGDHLDASLIWSVCGADEVQTHNPLRMHVVGGPIGCQLLNREAPEEWLAGDEANPPKRLSPNDQEANQRHKRAKRPIPDRVLNGRGRCPSKPAGP